MVSYSFLENRQNEEIHIEASDDQGSKTLCGKANPAEYYFSSIDFDENDLIYATEKFGWDKDNNLCFLLTKEEVRFIASLKGDRMCGTCMSTIYKTPD